MKKMTHTGIVKGSDRRINKNFKRKAYLRETKLYWIDGAGAKYFKRQNGFISGAWPMYYLDLETIKPIE